MTSPVKTSLPHTIEWATDTRVPNVGIAGSPAFAVYNNQLYCVHQGTGNDSQTAWYTVYDGFNWSKDTKIENVGMGGAPALAVFNDRLYCVHQGIGRDSQVPWYLSFDGSSWSKDTRIDNVGMGGAPALAVYNPTPAQRDGRLYCVHQGIGGDSQVPWYLSFDGSSWSRDTRIDNVGMGGAPALAVFNNRLYCVHQGIGGDSQVPWYLSFDGSSWSKDTKIENVGISSTAALASIFTGLYVGHQGIDGGSQSLWFTHGNESSNLVLPVQNHFDLLDVWGEGRINDDGLITGFNQAYNLNKFDQKISNGPAKGRDIPDLIPVREFDNPTFPVGDGLVTFLTLMGAPITAKVAREMERVLNKERGVPTGLKRGMIILYDPAPNHLKIFEDNTDNLMPVQLRRLIDPFEEVGIGNVHVYKFFEQ